MATQSKKSRSISGSSGAACPVRRTLDVIGDAWTVLILRDLFVQGARRYQDFLESLENISPNTLSNRLKKLEEHGIVERRFYSDHPPRAEYHLTHLGQSLGPIMVALRDWGRKNPA
ncbi:MAG: helix-turn-helix transcriptional regulator [Hyphomicrobium sp.]|nr:helix-turn-helix transcriptional regulator [Hyphomicrobium sp.]